MLFVDDIILVNKPREGINAELETCRDALESKSFKRSQTKDKCIEILVMVGAELRNI